MRAHAEPTQSAPLGPPTAWFAAARSHALLIALSLLSLLPLYWMIVTALRPENEIFSTAPWPENPTLDNVRRILDGMPLFRMLANTALVAAASTAAQLVTALLAAYAFARWRNRWTRAIFGLLTLTWLIPAQVIMVPNYLLVTSFGMLDTLAALILPHVASAFAIMLLYQSLRAFPEELIDAAITDGAGNWHILWRVIVPNVRPALASLGILLFISSWNDYFWPLLVTRSPDSAVIQIGLQMFFTQEGNQWGPLMAAASVASLPILAIYAVLQKQIVESFLHSGLK
ncbi:MAG: carbohydrate ABC transporter permease [Alphaproteobacteria bacterium]|nr:carbohydrate ABC transporter permease [Alphaproteobacteria bacterium]